MTRNGGPTAANDADRLPWLEPYRDPSSARVATPAPKAPSPRGKGGIVVTGIAALLIALGGGYWLGQLRAVPESRNPVSIDSAKPETIKTAQASQVLVPPVVEPKADEGEQKPVAATSTVKKNSLKKATSVRVHRGSARREKLKRRPLASDQLASVLGKQGEERKWPKMPSPGPAGQVIQLGAFSSPSRAERAYQARAGRYPLLSTMPKVIVPVVTKPRGEILYVLRLGTQSREQSTIVCRNLRNSGDHCLVIG